MTIETIFILAGIQLVAVTAFFFLGFAFGKRHEAGFYLDRDRMVE